MPEPQEQDFGQLVESLGEATEKAEHIAKRLEDGDISSEDQKGLKTELETLTGRIGELEQEKEVRQLELERDSMKAQVKGLTEAMTELQEAVKNPGSDFEFAGGVPTASDAPYGDPDGEHSFYRDVKNASRRTGGAGDQKAYQRLVEAAGGEDRVKAMVEGTDSAGGFLVAPKLADGLVRLKTVRTPLRSLFSSLAVTTDTLQITQQTGGLTAGWADELAAKAGSDMTFGQISVSVFTAAGLATVSNQLLADSTPSIDSLISTDIARRLAILEEKAFIDGSGTGQPRGILNTSGVNATTYTDATPTAGETLDAIIDAITQVQDVGLTEPTDIALHPRTWTRLIKSRETDGHYTVEGAFQSRSVQQGLPSRTLFGLPVTLTYNMPTNKGAGTNETRIIVGDFAQGLILDRQGIVIDDSTHVYFTTNQTVFRGEERVGFTAGRDPKVWSVIGGTGLI